MVVHRIPKVLGAVEHGGIIGKSGKSGKNSRIYRIDHGDTPDLRQRMDGDER